IDPSNPQTLYTGTGGGGVFKSSDGGVSWATSSRGLTDNNVYSLAIDPSNSQTLYFGTGGGGVFKSSDVGVSWATSSSGLTDSTVQCLALDPSNSQTLYAGTLEGVFRMTPKQSPTATSASPTPTPTNDDVTVGVWEQLASGDVLSLAIDPSNPQTLYAGTAGAGVSKSSDGGVSWADSSSGLTNSTVYSLVIDPSGTLYAGIDGGGVFRMAP
ncbi:MAG: hypothetical protein NTU59_02190, partial [Coprothermobacterota bacterium]|nr:hypothetical protein [Coprothermobacterota bacterium]